MSRAECFVDPIAHHGEGPVWDDRDGSLYWVDMLAGDVLRVDAGGQITRHHIGTVAAALRPRVAGGMVVAVERGFALVDDTWWVIETMPDVFNDATVRMNDGACDPQGRFYCGTMAYDARPGAGALYRLSADRTVQTVLTGVTVSNGLEWADERTAYYVDSATGGVDVMDTEPDTGELHGRRPFVAIDPSRGEPDGLTIDADGGIWVALWEDRAVHHYSAGGRLEDVVELPTSRVTACTFGGDALDTLYITTSALGLPDDPLAGAVFCIQPGVTGRPAARFAG